MRLCKDYLRLIEVEVILDATGLFEEMFDEKANLVREIRTYTGDAGSTVQKPP